MDGFDDIHVCSVDPWITDTPWTQHASNYSGHQIIVGPADDPQKVVDAITGLIDHPQKSVEISSKSKGIAAAGSLLPKTTKGLTGRSLLKMIKDAPPAPSTSGSLYDSGPEGTSVSGNLRERLEQQK